MSLSDPLAGWPTSEQEWVTTIGRQVYSDDVFSVDLSSLPRHHIRSEGDILTSAMKYVGAERVPNEDFWALDEEGQPVSILHGRDFVVWSLPQRAVCDCRHEYRMAVRLGPKASGKYAQHPLIKLENAPPGVRLSSVRDVNLGREVWGKCEGKQRHFHFDDFPRTNTPSFWRFPANKYTFM